MNSGRHLGVSARLPVDVYLTNTRDVVYDFSGKSRSVKWAGRACAIASGLNSRKYQRLTKTLEGDEAGGEAEG